MRKLSFASLAVATLIAAPAMAADMAVKARPIAVDPSYNWTGFYIGVNAGGFFDDGGGDDGGDGTRSF